MYLSGMDSGYSSGGDGGRKEMPARYLSLLGKASMQRT